MSLINLPKEIGYLIKNNNNDLSYMLPINRKKDGAFDSSTEKMIQTGKKWSGNAELNVSDNNPISGFYIGDSVERYSTSNKLFNVTDPRGFTIQVPTGNIATLLHNSTVIHGVVQEECIWGRDGSNHILIPVTSEFYKNTLKLHDKVENDLVKISSLKVGDVVMPFMTKDAPVQSDFLEKTFIGFAKITWYVEEIKKNSYPYVPWSQPVVVRTEEIEDATLVPVFCKKYTYNRDEPYFSFDASNLKIDSVVGSSSIDEVKEMREMIIHAYIHIPNRVKNKFKKSLEDSDVRGTMKSVQFFDTKG